MLEVIEQSALAIRAATEWVRIAAESVAERGRFAVALSGGRTPAGLYAGLAGDAALSARVDWRRTQVFWGDERHVPPGHADSNYGMARELLLSKVPIPESNVHRIRGEIPDAAEEARRYEEELRATLGPEPPEMPELDLVLLGLGTDGHTASLFPGTTALRESRRAVAPNWVESLREWRITLTVPAINRARTVIFLVSGADKAAAVKSVLEGLPSDEVLPAGLIRPRSGRVLWLVDASAARRLRSPPRGFQR